MPEPGPIWWDLLMPLFDRVMLLTQKVLIKGECTYWCCRDWAVCRLCSNLLLYMSLRRGTAQGLLIPCNL